MRKTWEVTLSMNIDKTKVLETFQRIINKSLADAELSRIREVHEHKTHFVPTKYRLVNGILQSLNIKFGNVLQEILNDLVKEHDTLQVEHELSGKKTTLMISSEVNKLIAEYIAKRQQEAKRINKLVDTKRGYKQTLLFGESYAEGNVLQYDRKLDIEFSNLLEEIFKIQKNANNKELSAIQKDVDLLFWKDDTAIYVEIKYNDDHDTGKFENINTKLITTWAGLAYFYREKIESKEQLLPILYYFNSAERYPPTYIPKNYILRGPELFERFIGIDYNILRDILQEIKQDPTYWTRLNDLICDILRDEK